MMALPFEAGTGQQNFIVRRARVSDIAAIREVARVTWEATYTESVLETNRLRVIASSYSDAALRRAFKRAGRDNWFCVAEAPTGFNAPYKLVGFAEISLRVGPRSDAELTRIYVLPSWQRQGIGRALLKALLSELGALPPDLRPPRLFLAVAAHNTRAIAFYEQRGFQYYRDFKANLPGQLLDMREYVVDL